MRPLCRDLILALLFTGGLCFAQAEATSEQVSLNLFYSPGCPECERFKQAVLPAFQDRYSGLYRLVWHDLNQAATIPLLLAYQQRCHNTDNGKISIVVDHSVFLSGYAAIATGLCDRVDEALLSRQAPGWTPPQPPPVNRSATLAAARTRAQALTLSVVVAGGLTDGFNPCATSTLIFFLSVLAAGKATRRTRLMVGTSFISAAFLVYLGLGLGFLFVLRQIPNLALVKTVIETVFGLCLIPLAALSFRDALRYRRTHRPDAVTLQIPRRIKGLIHTFTSAHVGVGGPLLGGFITGAGVTVLESVCTGQGYVPVLTYLLKTHDSNLRTWALLLLYNALFVLPLAVVFACFHRGLQIQALIDWSRRNLAAVKLLLGLFFAAMAVLLLWR